MSLPSSPSSAGAPSEPDAPSLPFLVGFDGSVRSLAAARWAAREAVSAGAALRLLHVGRAWPTIQPISPEFQPVLGASERAAEGVLSALAEELRALHPGLAVETATAEGGPAGELPRAAAHARLLVVGAGGHNHHVPLLGSTALHVAGRSEIPVVLVREPAPAAERGQRGVVVGVDPAGDYEAVLGFGYAWAAAHGLPLRAVHAGPEPSQSLEAAVAKVSAAYPEVATECVSRPGDPAHVLVDESATADLLVVGRRHHRPLHGMGPTDHAVAHYARGPVALIPHG
ncbi:universal stress protein [Streptomyces sp. NBC_00454]|uniref:universal stress protein n=1 Tax=Streptomyces sp. NBC_00454 TaxID=2975747 RepID=UPI0032454F9F